MAQISQREQEAADTAAAICPNCRDYGPTVDGECWGCGYTGHCRICGEATEDFGDYPDLNYCSTVCAREAAEQEKADL